MRRLSRSLGEHVGKVKKGAGVTGERNGKAKAAKKPRRIAATRAKSSKPTTRTGRSPAPANAKRVVKAKTPKTKAAKTNAHPARVAVKRLDPLQKCGPNTSVQLLYRVDESVDGRSTQHLVFFDRHGWYCEHGRTCPAVGHAKKYKGQIARVS